MSTHIDQAPQYHPKEDRILQDHKIRAVDRPGHEPRTHAFTWCSACKEGFDSEGQMAFAFTRCPLCGAQPEEGFLPWSWIRAHWRNELPSRPEPGTQYEAYPPTCESSNDKAA